MSDLNIDPVDESEELAPDDLDVMPPMGYPPTDEELGAQPVHDPYDDSYDDEETPKKKKSKKRPSKTTVQRQKNSREMTFSQWCEWINERVGWDAPGVVTRLTRIRPTWYRGESVGGLLDERESAKFTEHEVMERFGGGEYQLDVSGPRKSGPDGLPPLSFKKRFRIAGAPKLSDEMRPEDKPLKQVKADGEAEKTAVSHLGQMASVLLQERERRSSGGDEKYWARTMSAHDDRIRAREEIAEARVREAQEAQRRAEEDKIRIAERVRREQAEMEERMRQTQAENNSLMAQLLPTFSTNANQQVQQTMATFQAREQRIEADHAKEVQQLQRSNELSLERADQQRIAELARQDAMYQAQLGTIQAQLVTTQQQLEGERSMNLQLREEIRRLHMEQLTAYQRDRDPMEQIAKMQAFNEMAKEVIGSGGGAEVPGGLSDDAPDYMRLIAHATQTLGPAIQAVLQQKEGQQRQQQQQQLTPEQAQALQQQQMALQQQQQLAAAQQQALVPTEQPVRIKTSELKKALEILAAVRGTAEPKDAAGAAMAHGDHRVLRAISSRPPEVVVAEIDRHGILPAPLADESGREYLRLVLVELRQQAHAPGSTTEDSE